MKMSISIPIHASPSSIFPWISEPEKAIHWQKGVKDSKVIQETPERIGTTFIEEIEENGKALVMYGEITNYIQNELMAFRLDSKIHKVNVQYSVNGNENISTVSVISSINWKFPMSIISFFIGQKIKAKIIQQTESELIALKQFCEHT
jgi:hypothetical protein